MNVKAGDLAIVAGDNAVAANLGKIVQVIRFHGADPWKRCDATDYWEVETAGAALIGFTTGKKYKRGLVRDICLRPVSGLPDAQDIDQDIKEPA